MLNAQAAAAQQFQIGIIDFYGLRRVSASESRRALTFAEGDSISLEGDEPPAFLAESERRLATLPGVVRARTNIVCCDQGRLIVYVGVEEEGGATLRFRAAPQGTARLPADLVQAGDDYWAAFTTAVERGDAGEDGSRGHALCNDPTTRAVQERFVAYAARDTERLRGVLRESSNADQRALAAQVLGYVADKQSVVDDLVYGMSDPSENVRNNSMRTLMVFTRMTPAAGTSVPRVPYAPFVNLLHSLVWTDRNKSSLALMELTESRDADLLERLRNEAMQSLADIARWKNEGHATPGLLMLGRIAGWADDDVRSAWRSGQREKIIAAALAAR
ncbi:MAG TPA: hypothetical protein VEC56_10600 [Candidatus Krumholzibacteria bacterium]|nr:hypothetical protein [Candidatus Krumholzibacteria bacterium]